MQFTPIGQVHSCFSEKFGTPRQPGLAPSAEAELILVPPFDAPEALRGLEGCSHLWVIFVLHLSEGWSPTVRPPRLGGNERRGVFATRSPFRPNPIGLSVVELAGLINEPGRRGLRLRNHDLVDGTPVLDIKPYLPYCDAIADAVAPAGFAEPPARRPVRFLPEVEAALAGRPRLRALLQEVLGLDPRPGYRREEEERTHGTGLAGYNARWEVRGGEVWVTALEAL